MRGLLFLSTMPYNLVALIVAWILPYALYAASSRLTRIFEDKRCVGNMSALLYLARLRCTWHRTSFARYAALASSMSQTMASTSALPATPSLRCAPTNIVNDVDEFLFVGGSLLLLVVAVMRRFRHAQSIFLPTHYLAGFPKRRHGRQPDLHQGQATQNRAEDENK